MTITYTFDRHGGFYAADVDAQHIEYAYPTSEHATKAKKNPAKVAAAMLDLKHLSYYQAQSWWTPRFQSMYQGMKAAQQ